MPDAITSRELQQRRVEARLEQLDLGLELAAGRHGRARRRRRRRGVGVGVGVGAVAVSARPVPRSG